MSYAKRTTCDCGRTVAVLNRGELICERCKRIEDSGVYNDLTSGYKPKVLFQRNTGSLHDLQLWRHGFSHISQVRGMTF